jgi:hypothetical protein
MRDTSCASCGLGLIGGEDRSDRPATTMIGSKVRRDGSRGGWKSMMAMDGAHQAIVGCGLSRCLPHDLVPRSSGFSHFCGVSAPSHFHPSPQLYSFLLQRRFVSFLLHSLHESICPYRSTQICCATACFSRVLENATSHVFSGTMLLASPRVSRLNEARLIWISSLRHVPRYEQ